MKQFSHVPNFGTGVPSAGDSQSLSAVVQGDSIKTVAFYLQHRGGNSCTCLDAWSRGLMHVFRRTGEFSSMFYGH
jgi:hypothetical protein